MSQCSAEACLIFHIKNKYIFLFDAHISFNFMGMSFQWSNLKVKKLPFEKGKVYWDNINLWKAEEKAAEKL